MASHCCIMPVMTSSKSSLPSNLIHTTCRRYQSTFRRTRKALKVKPDPSFAPTKTEARDHIIFNPPSSIPSVYHTPSKFLPPSDPRRVAAPIHTAPITTTIRSRATNPFSTVQDIPQEAPQISPAPILRPAPPKTYNVTPEQVEEIRRLRTEDSVQWTRVRLAKKFNCSQYFVSLCVKSPEAGMRHSAQLEAIKEKWGKVRTEAREDRKARAKLWGRD